MFSTKGFIACIPLMHLMQGTYHRYIWLFIAIFTLHGFWMQNHECDLAQSSQGFEPTSSGSAGIMKSRHSELWKKSRVQHNPVNCGNIYYMHMIANVYIYINISTKTIREYLLSYSPIHLCLFVYLCYTFRSLYLPGKILYIYINVLYIQCSFADETLIVPASPNHKHLRLRTFGCT